EAHVFVSSLPAVALAHDDEHHLDRVLRLEPTDIITVSDGAGRWATANWSRPRGLTLVSQIFHEPTHAPLTIGCAIPKGDRPELVVQKLTELGVDRILLFETGRSVVRWDDEKKRRQLERLRRIAHEAAMQSRRVFLPAVDCVAFDQVIQFNGVAMAEPGGRDVLDETITTLLIGPEGGFDSDELDYAVPKVGLSRHVLRVETAAIVAASMLIAAHD
ncbi:MAG: rsmE, partial [Ilumatobacteraceae bacterium]|nr:rsmE [Ilumatobacteraceae bacterium]